jgi:hypothetical protein
MAVEAAEIKAAKNEIVRAMMEFFILLILTELDNVFGPR